MMKITIGVVLAFVTAASVAEAQTQALVQPSFDLEELTLDPAAVDSLVVVGGRTLPEGGLRLGFALGYERDPLVVVVNGASQGALVSDRLTGDLMAAFGITDRLEITADIPMILYQTGDNLALYGLAPVESAGMSNPLVDVRYGIVKGDTFNLAAGIEVGLPFGSAAALGGQGASGISGEPEVAATFLGGPMLVAAQVGALLRYATALDPNRNIGSMFDAAASVEVAKSSWRPELILHLTAPLTQNVPLGAEGLLGARHDLGTPAVEAFALVGGGVGDLPGLPIFRAFLGVAWRPDLGKKTAPAEPAAAPASAAPQCPPAPTPAAAPQCPAAPECTSSDPCAPGRAHAPKECPVDDSKDTDGDGVPDVIDNCPSVKGPAENHGCPAEQPQQVFIEREKACGFRSRLKFNASVNFGSDLSTIGEECHPVLDQLAKLLEAHPELKELRVEGHTDSTGTVERNRVLSEARALAVRDYLEKHGVKKGRLVSQGFGASRPIDTNETEAGKARNRRVEVVDETEACQP